MKKLLALVGLAALGTSPAYAGIGATAAIGSTNEAAGVLFAPTLDYRGGGVLAQVHLLDLIGQLPNKYVDVGFDITGVALKRKVGEDVEGVVMPGAAVLLYAPTSFDSVGFHVLAETRFGAEMKQGAGIGIYVVPQLGVSNLTGTFGVAYGGSLQVSAWLKTKK
jgi:hypothetical protein